MKTDNETNKSNISTLQEEQETQNANIENLQENDTNQNELILKLQQENEQIKESLINIETEQSKSIHVEDASTVAGVLEVEGNAEQETREGYNLLDINKGVISNDCTMTQISKSEYKITVNNNADWARIDIPISLLSTKTYRASIYTKVSNANARIEIGTYKDNTQYGSKLSNNSTDYKKQIIDNVETNINRFVIWLNPDSVSEEFEVYIKELMLYEGSEEKEYEPYGAMPSPKFPSAIKCLGSNKNLFSENYYGLFSGNQSATKEIINNKDKEIKVTTTANAYSGIFLNTTSEAMQELIEQINGKTVTYSFEAKADTNINLQIGRSSNTKIVNLNNEWQKFDITYENTNTCSIYFYNNSATVTNFYVRKIKLEEGEKATSYSINRTR